MALHYRCFACGECQGEGSEYPVICRGCVDKLWIVHILDVNNKRLSSVRELIKGTKTLFSTLRNVDEPE